MTFSVTKPKKSRLIRCMQQFSEEDNMDDLGLKIMALDKVKLSSERKNLLKKNILNQLSLCEESRMPLSISNMISNIRKAVIGMNIASKKAQIKETVFEAIESVPQNTFIFQRFFSFFKKATSGGLALMLILGIFSFIGISPNIVMAGTLTRLDSFSGEVFVERNGQDIAVYDDMEIYENDKIKTGENGTAVIVYFDDSVCRLDKNSEIEINKLLNKRNALESYVEISLISGSTWARVISLVDQNSAFVVKAKDIYAKAKKAAFNVSVLNDEKVEVKVFNRAIEVKKAEQVDKVLSGSKAVVNGKVEILLMNDDDKDGEWVKDNMKNDKQYMIGMEERLVAAKIKSIGVSSEDSINSSLENSLQEKIYVMLSFDDIAKKKKEFAIAEKKFAMAQLKLQNVNITEEDKENILNAFDEFGNIIADFNKIIEQVAYTDKAYAEELRTYIDEKILAYKKELSSVLPGSNLYIAKEAIDKISLISVKDEGQKAEQKLEQVVDKISEAEQLASFGEQEIAKEVISNSAEEISDVKQMVESIQAQSPETKEKLLSDLTSASVYAGEVSTVASVPSVAEVENLAEVENKEEEVKEEPVVVSVPTVPAIVVPVVTAIPVVAEPESKEEEAKEEEKIEEKYGVPVGDKVLPPGLN